MFCSHLCMGVFLNVVCNEFSHSTNMFFYESKLRLLLYSLRLLKRKRNAFHNFVSEIKIFSVFWLLLWIDRIYPCRISNKILYSLFPLIVPKILQSYWTTINCRYYGKNKCARVLKAILLFFRILTTNMWMFIFICESVYI